MNLSAPFIHRPVATTLLTIAIAIAGAIAFEVLPVSPLPQVDFPTISVNASLPGGSAEIMASSVATPLERQFGHIAGVTEMTSSSSLGTSSVTIQFDLSRNIDGAARDVQAAINAARTYLPANLPANPTYRKVNPADAPIMIIGLTSDKYGPDKLYDEASTIIQQKLSQIQGVGQVNAGGGALPSVRVEVNPTKLASYGLTMADLQSVLRLQNSDLAKGQITDGNISADILANDQISHAEDYKPIIVGYNKGAAMQLSDVADVVDSVQNVRTAGYLNGKRAIVLIVFRQPGANIIDTVDRISSELPSIKASIPQGIDTTIVLDRTTTIRASVNDVERTLMISIVSGDRRSLHLFAKRPRHACSRRGRSRFSDRHVRGDVSLRLQPGQPVADGADHLHRFRRRRRHRGDGEHHAAYGSGHGTVRRRAEGRKGDRFHRLIHQHVADRGLHSACC